MLMKQEKEILERQARRAGGIKVCSGAVVDTTKSSTYPGRSKTFDIFLAAPQRCVARLA